MRGKEQTAELSVHQKTITSNRLVGIYRKYEKGLNFLPIPILIASAISGGIGGYIDNLALLETSLTIAGLSIIWEIINVKSNQK
jgi:hypothetical protein